MPKDEVLVKVEGLSKKFCKDLKTSLWYGVQDLFSNMRGNKSERLLREQEFWAVKDIDFELRRGECLGLIGHNGAGKSTLLKILNGLIKPDAGKVTIKGRVGALIELGAGFNPILTGRENIYNNGAILGFTRKEINEKLEEIIDFAEIREFIDMPVQNYSSGMKVRLGFAIAAQMEPDVLIIDEVLAVGDLGFRAKCFKKIDAILPNTAIIFVSHSMPIVSRICNNSILLTKGKTVFQGKNVSEAIDIYYSSFAKEEEDIIINNGDFKLEEAKFIGVSEYENSLPQLNWNENLKIYFKFSTVCSNLSPVFRIFIYDKELRPVAILKQNSETVMSKKNSIEFTLTHENLQLSKGIYSFDLSVTTQNINQVCLRIRGILNLQIIAETEEWPPFLLDSAYSFN